MIDYYFQSNEEDAEAAFNATGRDLAGAFGSYVDDLLDYLKSEYNTPISYFLGCTTPDDVYSAFEDGIPVHEFADITMMNDSRNGANLIIYGDKKVTS